MARFPFFQAVLIIFFLAFTGFNNAHAEEHGWEPQSNGNAAETGPDRNLDGICERLNKIPFPSQDQPTKTEKGGLRPCHSTSARDLYYGIGRAADPQNARLCAFLERSGAKPGEVDLTSGSAILAMIYANGRGVPRNLDLAQKAVCESAFAEAERWGELGFLEELKSSPDNPVPEACITDQPKGEACKETFDICDFTTSSLMSAFCQDITSNIKEHKNSFAFHKATSSRWPVSHQKFFEHLDKAARAYFHNHAWNEINREGSLRDTFSMKEYDRYLSGFRADIVSLEKGKKLSYSSDEWIRADADLNATYRRTLKSAPEPHGYSITADEIQDTQRSWLVYRDAWVKFAAIHYPQFTTESVKTWLTRQRTGVLKDIPKEF